MQIGQDGAHACLAGWAHAGRTDSGTCRKSRMGYMQVGQVLHMQIRQKRAHAGRAGCCVYKHNQNERY